MAQTTLYQYRRSDGALALKAISLFNNDSGLPLDGVVYQSEPEGTGIISLAGVKEWGSIAIGVELTIDGDALGWLLPESESKKPQSAIAGMVSVTSPSAKFRRGVRLEWKGSGTWRGTIELRRTEVNRDIFLKPLVVRTKRSDASGNFGTYQGAILASGDEITLTLHERGLPPGGDFRYKWVDFRQSDVSALKERPDDVFFISPEAKPVVYLNIRWPGLKPVLESKAVIGVNAALRRCFRSLIGQAGWVQLLVTSVGSVRKNSDDLYEVEGEPWRAPLARWVATKLYPDLEDQEQLRALANAFQDPSEIGMVVAKIQSLAHDKTRAGKDLDIAAKLIEDDDVSEEEPEE